MPGNIELIPHNAPQPPAKRIATESDKTVLGQQLLHLGFDDNQCRQLLEKGAVLINDVIRLHPEFNAKGFTNQHIVNIAIKTGSRGLTAVPTYFKDLLSQIGVENIVKIAAHSGGANNLAAVKEHFEALINLKFSQEQIVKVAAHIGGSKTLAAVKEHFEALVNLKFSQEQIVKMAAHDGGSKTLAVVIKHFEALKNLGYDIEDIVSLANRNGGSVNIIGIINKQAAKKRPQPPAKRIATESDKTVLGQQLLNLGFDDNQCRQLLEKGAVLINDVIRLHPEFSAKGFTNQHIVEIAINAGSRGLTAVPTYFKDLSSQIGVENIVKIAAHGDGANNLVAVKEHFEALVNLKFSQEQIVNMAAHVGGANNLAAVKEHFEALTNLNFNQEQIVNMAANNGGANNLAAVKEHLEALANLKFSQEQIVNMAAHKGGANNLAAVIKNFEALKNLGYDIEDIVSLANRNSGSLNIIGIINKQAAKKRPVRTDAPQPPAKRIATESDKTVLGQQLLNLGFDDNQCRQLLEKGAVLINDVIRLHPEFNAKGFTNQHIVKIAINAGSRGLTAVPTYFNDLLSQFGVENIVKMAAHNGGANNLAAVKEHFEVLANLKFSQEQIVKMAAHIGGASNLAAVKEHFEALANLKFSQEQIVKMAAHIGGASNLAAVITHFQELKSRKFNVKQIVKTAAHPVGALNIKSALESGYIPEDVWTLSTSLKQDIAGVELNNNRVTFVLKPQRDSSLFYSRFNRALYDRYDYNTFFRELFKHPAQSTNAPFLTLKSPHPFTHGEQVLALLKLITDVDRLKTYTRDDFFLKQIEAEWDTTSPIANKANITFDKIYEAHYKDPHLPPEIVKACLAHKFKAIIGLMEKNLIEGEFDHFTLETTGDKCIVYPFDAFYNNFIIDIPETERAWHIDTMPKVSDDLNVDFMNVDFEAADYPPIEEEARIDIDEGHHFDNMPLNPSLLFSQSSLQLANDEVFEVQTKNSHELTEAQQSSSKRQKR